jgi:hypothetical protein
LVVEVELLQGFAGGEAGGGDPQLRSGGVMGGDFSVEDGDQVVLVGPAGVSGLAGETDGGLTDPGAPSVQRQGSRFAWLARSSGHLPAAIGSLCVEVDTERAVVVGEIAEQVIIWSGFGLAERGAESAAASTWTGSVTVSRVAQTRWWRAP